MAGEQNLKPFYMLTEEEQRAIRSKGGKASVKARRERKTLREELLLLLSKGDTQEKISLSLIKEALDGSTKAFEVIRDTIGEKPKDVIQHEGEINNPYSNLTEEELRKLAK